MKKLLPLLFIFNFQLSIFNSFAQTNVSGFINANTTWTLAGSPYIVVGNALVSQGYTLTIDPGVVVKFDTTKALQIDGTLIAIGTAANRITFTSSSANPVRGSWAKLHFSTLATDAIYNTQGNYVSGCILKYCDVLYGGGLGYGGIHIESAKPYISQCNIKSSSSAGIYCAGTSYILDSSLVADNTGYGLYFSQYAQFSCGLIVRGDTIENNLNGGIYLDANNTTCTTSIIGNYFISNSTNASIQLEDVNQHVNIQYNSFLNNHCTNTAVININSISGINIASIEGNVFINNNSSSDVIYIYPGSTSLKIKNNLFENNINDGSIILITGQSANDTISCNKFLNNQTHGAVLYLGTTIANNGFSIRYNLFNGNIFNGTYRSSILYVSQTGGIIDFAYNTIINNSAATHELCYIYANVSNSNQNLKIHHNEFSNNTASKIIFITGPQINNSVPNFCYFKHNNFYDVSPQYTLYDSIPYGSPNIKADSNYWGSTNTAHIDSIIYDYFDFANQSVVYYSLILQTKEDVDTVCPGSITTVVSDIEKPINSFNIYPNPTHNTFTISLNQWTVDNGQLTVFDIAGRCVYEKPIRNFAQSEIRNNFSPGIYFVKVNDGERSATQKLIIQ
jgi:hypothetical protein